MDFHALPFDLKIELLLKFFDDPFADVAEGSDIIGKNLNAYGHESNLVFSTDDALAHNNTLLSLLERDERALFRKGASMKIPYRQN